MDTRQNSNNNCQPFSGKKMRWMANRLPCPRSSGCNMAKTYENFTGRGEQFGSDGSDSNLRYLDSRIESRRHGFGTWKVGKKLGKPQNPMASLSSFSPLLTNDGQFGRKYTHVRLESGFCRTHPLVYLENGWGLQSNGNHNKSITLL